MIFSSSKEQNSPSLENNNIDSLNNNSFLPNEIAVKVYIKEKMKSKIRQKIIENEYQVLKILDHSNIIKFYDRINTSSQIHLIMEFFKGQGLDVFLKRFIQKRLPSKIAKPILIQILKGLDYLHNNNIYHRGII